MPINVNDQSAEIIELAKEWTMLDALQAGTPAMRSGAQKWLPKWPAEENDAYNTRLETATLFPAYRRTVGVMAGKPFAKALSIEDAAPEIEKLAENIDNQGVNLHSFAAEMFRRTVGFGLAGVLVEYPRVVKKGTRTKAQVEKAGLRPYFVRVRHNQILGWRVGQVAGTLGLTQLRLLESFEEADGQWGVKTIDQVRVLYPGAWEVYRQTGSRGAWALAEGGRTSLTRIPFVPFYGLREDFMIGKAPMLDLAYLNIKHWQSQSDQDTILHAARVPILTVAGVEAVTLAIGGSSAINLGTNPDAKIEWVEHTGAAIGAGENSIKALEEQMIQTGAELLVKKPGDRTATESANDAEANKSDLQRMAETFEDGLDMALEFMAEYAHLDRAGSVSLFSDYGASTLSDASATLVADLNSRGLLSKETTLNELKRRGVLAAEVDPKDEIEKAAAEGPALGELGVEDDGAGGA